MCGQAMFQAAVRSRLGVNAGIRADRALPTMLRPFSVLPARLGRRLPFEGSFRGRWPNAITFVYF